MVCPRKENIEEGSEGEGLDRADGVDREGSGEINGSRTSGAPEEGHGSGRASRGFLARLTDALREGGDDDLLFESGEEECGMLQWLRALDLQVLGACRADERLKPLLKFNISEGVAEDRLISQLSQHFEVTEVGNLARCLCVPLVSVRAGRVNEEGNLLCPTTTKGYLQLTLLPSSDMRLSFCGDDGVNEKLGVVGHFAENSEVMIEEISADSAGRTFLLRFSENHASYFWCAEKSRLVGSELLSKMKDLLRRRPSLSQLTGISAFRLDAFATHLRAYLLRSSNTVEANSWASSSISMENACSPESKSSSHLSATRSTRIRLSLGQSAKSHPSYQSSLGLRPNNFKDGLLRNSLARAVTKVKLRQDGENNISPKAINSTPVQVSSSCTSCSSSTSPDDNKLPGCSSRSFHHPLCYFPEMSTTSCLSSSSTALSFGDTSRQALAMSSSELLPYYCWCPPCTSSFQHSAIAPHPPSMASEPALLPPLSSVLSNVGLSLPFGLPNPALDLSDLPALDLPSIFPLPSPFASIPNTQQFPTFTPFMSDPIVHIPMIEVCSSGQGYLVSAGPTISSAVPPLLPSIASPLIPEAESEAEKNARETIRMLMASAPTNPQLIKVLPAVLTSVTDDFPCVLGMNHGALVAGSRGLYSGTKDVDVATKCICSGGIPPYDPAKIATSDLLVVKNAMPDRTSNDNLEDGLPDRSAEEGAEGTSSA
ncbi:hypothetical protein Taro_009501 [Colocasia esculenta]|uniref:Pru domain-containing protein n=1 Tax=Colocasia esculenta TaxID=4460 RepID=A0A843TWI7_COLES|nr:hypothetical protein [Colocasia esculenta]